MIGAHLTKTKDGTMVLGLDVAGGPLTYSLESLPSLIGERQFKILCEALGIDEAMAEARVMRSDLFNAGEFAARAIQRASEHRRSQRQREREAQDQVLFEGMQP